MTRDLLEIDLGFRQADAGKGIARACAMLKQAQQGAWQQIPHSEAPDPIF